MERCVQDNFIWPQITVNYSLYFILEQDLFDLFLSFTILREVVCFGHQNSGEDSSDPHSNKIRRYCWASNIILHCWKSQTGVPPCDSWKCQSSISEDAASISPFIKSLVLCERTQRYFRLLEFLSSHRFSVVVWTTSDAEYLGQTKACKVATSSRKVGPFYQFPHGRKAAPHPRGIIQL